MKIDEIFGDAIKKMVKDAVRGMKRVPGDTGEIEPVKKDGKIEPRSRTMAALADATAAAKKTTRAAVMPTGKIPERK
jgi:hypothetical protein